MKEEIFRAHNVCVLSDSRMILENFDLSLFRGEILGVYGFFSMGKAAILGLVNRGIKPSSGAVFFSGARYDGSALAAANAPRVFQVSGGETFIDSMSLWENMLVLRPDRNGVQLLSAGSMRRYMAVLLREYGIDLPPDITIRSLSPIMRFMLELIKAKLQKADIVLAADLNLEGKPAEMSQLKALMRRMANEGMAILLTSHRFTLLRRYADRIAFLSKETIIKCGDVAVENGAYVGRIFASVVGENGARPPRKRKSVPASPVYTVKQLQITNTGEALTLFSGETVEILRATEKLIGGLNAVTSGKKDVLCVRSPVSELVIRELSLEENIYFGRMDRLATRGIIRRDAVKVILREFADWYGDDRLLGLKNCMTLERHDIIAIAIFKMYIQQPKVLLCLDMRKDMDHISRKLMMTTAQSLTDKGSAVCFVDTNNGDYNCTADRSFYETADGRLELISREDPEAQGKGEIL